MRFSALPLILGLAATTGCASSLQPPAIASDAPLGRVIIYRNGVAYFERFAEIERDKLTLQVPPQRVDDFLKSLTIVDATSGEAMPLSYPTLDSLDGNTAMTVSLPAGHHRLKISYVTESPAWKPTYRVILGAEGKEPARIQGWAVVDNVSGEDWNHIQIGVGSTSALSFRYDLHSVQLVERETLTSGSLLAVAPPTGGSPYAVASRRVRVMGGVSQEAFANLQSRSGQAMSGAYQFGGEQLAAESIVTSDSSEGDDGGGRGDKKPNDYAVRLRQMESQVSNLKNQIRRSRTRLRIEGFANATDADKREASLARANALRDQLLSEGVPADRIEVVGTGKVSNEAVRVVETDEATVDRDGDGVPDPPDASGAEAADDGQALGSAHFLSKAPMSIERDHSAMVGILNAETEAERVYFYDPVSERGSTKFAFNAVRVMNPSEFTLDSGPFTVYAKGQFLGEGLSEPILPKSVAFIPYALDRSIIADPQQDTREEISELLTIQRGIVTTETRRIRRTRLTLTNRHSEDAEVYVRHLVTSGYELVSDAEGGGSLRSAGEEADAKGPKALRVKVQKLGGAYLFPVPLKGGEALELVIEESTPIMKTVDINTDVGIDQMALYLRGTARLDPELKKKLEGVVKTHTELADLQEKIALGRDQMSVYRTRVDELTFQLADLKKVPQAEKLRRHLTEKMQEISERLQKATLEMAELQGEVMTRRIVLQDELADLSLQKKKPDAEPPAAPATDAKKGGV
ncbi:MAG: OmpA family protein [Myxococcales bacterium]|nr:OmpA family protein [Myxococcales bacterium]